MKCINCNEEIPDGVTVCPKCGVGIPPKLDVNEENLTEGVTDISDSNISDYVENIEEEPKQVEQKRDDVEILIPSVQQNVELEEEKDTPEVLETIGEVDEFVELSDDIKVIERKNPIDKILINIKSTKSIPKNIFIITIIIVLALGLFTGKVIFSKNYCNVPVIRDVGGTKIKTVSDGDNNETSIGEYLYKIPKTFTYDRADHGVRIYSQDDSWVIYIKSIHGNYNNIKSGRVSIRETLATSMTINDTKELAIQEHDVIAYETTENVTNRIVAFTQAPNDNIFYIEVFSASNNFNYDVLDIAVDIAANAEYVEHTSNMENYKVIDKSEIALKAANEYAALQSNNN